MKDYLKSSNQARCMELYASVLRRLTEGKRYLSSNVTAEQLAHEMECTPRQLSAAVQIGSGKNFSALINGLRLKEVCRRMSSLRYKSQTVEDIGLGCGFKSRQAFYVAFEKQMAETPLQWREQHMRKC